MSPLKDALFGLLNKQKSMKKRSEVIVMSGFHRQYQIMRIFSFPFFSDRSFRFSRSIRSYIQQFYLLYFNVNILWLSKMQYRKKN